MICSSAGVRAPDRGTLVQRRVAGRRPGAPAPADARRPTLPLHVVVAALPVGVEHVQRPHRPVGRDVPSLAHQHVVYALVEAPSDVGAEPALQLPVRGGRQPLAALLGHPPQVGCATRAARGTWRGRGSGRRGGRREPGTLCYTRCAPRMACRVPAVKPLHSTGWACSRATASSPYRERTHSLLTRCVFTVSAASRRTVSSRRCEGVSGLGAAYTAATAAGLTSSWRATPRSRRAPAPRARRRRPPGRERRRRRRARPC